MNFLSDPITFIGNWLGNLLLELGIIPACSHCDHNVHRSRVWWECLDFPW